jgi:protein TonB
LSPLNSLKRARPVREPLWLILLISVGLHSLLAFPFWRYQTLHLTVPDRPLRMVLEIPLTVPAPPVESPPRRMNKIVPSKLPLREKPLVKPIEKPRVQPVAQSPEPPPAKPMVKTVEDPELPPAPAEKARTVVPEPEAKPVIAAAEPVNTVLPQPDKTPSSESSLVNQAVPLEAVSPAPPATKKPDPEPPAVSPAYLRSVFARIQKSKHYPRLARERGIEGETLLEFTLFRDGKLGDIRVLRSSGFAILDEEALRTVRRATPFPGLPEGTRAGRVALKVTLSFLIKD